MNAVALAAALTASLAATATAAPARSAAALKQRFTATVPSLGTLSGVVSNASASVAFFGAVPYGKPPVGELRWQPPQKFGSWSGTRDASWFGNRCAQIDPPHDHVPDPRGTSASEDCLFLNVFTPVAALPSPTDPGSSSPSSSSSSRRLLPVMVWIHGGGYTSGQSNDYAGDCLVARSNKSVVVVTVNYRLAQFGFLASEALQQRSSDGSVGNFGIQDQRLAIEWVRDNSAAFGGNGSAVTIFGESAGGNSVINHLAAPASRGLYQAAIIESGAYDKGATTLDKATKNYDALLNSVRCTVPSCLVTKTTAELLAAFGETAEFGPVVDGKELPAAPIDLIAEGNYNNKVPVMIGSNRDEMAFFTILEKVPKDLGELEVELLLRNGGLNHKQVVQVKDLYASGGDYPYPSNLGPFSHWWWLYTRSTTDSVPGLGPCAVRWLGRMLLDGGTPVMRAYFFAQPTACNAKRSPALCAALEAEIPGIVTADPVVVPHASEIQYAFGVTEVMYDGAQTDLAAAMSAYWAAFGRTGGDPSVGGAPPWPRYNATANNVLRFEEASGGGIRVQTRLREKACDWQEANMVG